MNKKTNTVEQLILPIKNSNQTHDEILDTQTDEIFIILCGPIGSPFKNVVEELSTKLESYDYEVSEFKLSKYITEQTEKIPETEGFDRTSALIDNGNNLREKYGNSILAELAIREIAIIRESNLQAVEGKAYKSLRKAYIFNSIKNLEELRIFQSIYSSSLYIIGVYSPKEDRIENLKTEKRLKDEEIFKLIDRDSGEEKSSGQSVRKIFPLSDYFLSISNKSSILIEHQIGRFIDIIFRTKIITPSTIESGMYSAYSASLNSSCMSRQVGASIIDIKSGEIKSVGWNEVPAARGGVYTNNNKDDSRCHLWGNKQCHNDNEKRTIVNEIAQLLIEEKIVDSSKLSDILRILPKSRISDLIEFSRAVHAEMLALLTISKQENLENLALFTTTYPCHNCARHIVASGIMKIFYIEPYVKSMATTLHSDSVTESVSDTNKVQILQFYGVSPTRFRDLFRSGNIKRKDNSGILVKLDPKTASPISPVLLESIPALEAIVVSKLKNKGL